DPMALGLRYVEIETLNRQINDEEKAVRQEDRMALNDAQRAKVKTLEDARALKTVIAEAECETMLDPLPPLPLVVINGLPIGVVPGGLSGPGVWGLPSCGGFTFNRLPLP